MSEAKRARNEAVAKAKRDERRVMELAAQRQARRHPRRSGR
ncbi:MAG TPA: hypothetical protein VFR63_04490 [Gaiellaceae bacterium]|nr:hypothetical protein [Gaiellaceae bacterium]